MANTLANIGFVILFLSIAIPGMIVWVYMVSEVLGDIFRQKNQ